MHDFRWIGWSVNHIAEHGVTPAEVEYVVNHPARGWPRRIENEKRLVWGPTAARRWLQVIYLIEGDDTVFVIHARDLDDREKRQNRKKSR